MEADGRITMFDLKDVEGVEQTTRTVQKHQGDEGKHSLLKSSASDSRFVGLYSKPLSCFGCGIGWFCFVMGFVFPLLWYFATILYFGNYYLKDPREREGLAASAIAALICSVIVLITVLVVYL